MNKKVDTGDFTADERPRPTKPAKRARKRPSIDQLGLPVRERKRAVTIYVSDLEDEAVSKAAKRLQRSRTEVIRAAIRLALDMDLSELQGRTAGGGDAEE